MLEKLGIATRPEWGRGIAGDRRAWELWGATYQKVEATLDLLEAIDVLRLRHPYGGEGEKAVGHRLSRDPPALLPCSSALTSLTLVLFLPQFLLLTMGVCLGFLQLSHE